MKIFSKPKNSPTRTVKGRFWATVMMLLCGSYSIWANITSGENNRDSIIVSVLPPLVVFILPHLIGYFTPKKWYEIGLLYIGGTSILIMAFIGSGYHIYEKSLNTGQPWQIALTYPFITDFAMVMGGLVLVKKVSATAAPAKQTYVEVSPINTPIVTQATSVTKPPRVRPSRSKAAIAARAA